MTAYKKKTQKIQDTANKFKGRLTEEELLELLLLGHLSFLQGVGISWSCAKEAIKKGLE